MNPKRLLVACLAVFVFIFMYEWVFHGMLLQETYAQTATLWRPDADFKSHFGWLVAGQVLITVIFCLLYAMRGGTRVGAGQGAVYGVLIALLKGGTSLVVYAVQPVGLNLIGAWIVGNIVEGAIAGAILGAIYKPAMGPAAPVSQ